jgi:hypothetical protein
MFRIARLVCLLMGFTGRSLVAERTLVAEGDHVILTESGGSQSAHWKLWGPEH